VINDEISPDFEHACHVASVDFGLSWIELRNLWGKSLTDLSTDQVSEAKGILKKYNLRVTDLASPLFKTDLPGAPLSKEVAHHDKFSPDVAYKAQDELLEKLIVLSKSFGTDRIRCFDFWRLEDSKPWREEINRKLTEAAERCEKQGLILLLENEMACNTGSGKEAAEVLSAIPNRAFMLNWDAANSGTFAGDVPFPDDYALLPKQRIGHVHCKNVIRTPGEKQTFEWQPVNVGLVDWVGQFRALKRDGYHYAVSLETHWRGAPGTDAAAVAEASSRISMQGLKECLNKAMSN
jgi:sugar phosphate isomerase/epimerase